jgi:hypothetical protein
MRILAAQCYTATALKTQCYTGIALKTAKKGPNAVATALETAKCYTGIAFEPQQKDGRKWRKQW